MPDSSSSNGRRSNKLETHDRRERRTTETERLNSQKHADCLTKMPGADDCAEL